jgi:hypothetical protein
MAQNPAALHPDPASRPRPYRPALVATPGASEWVSCVSSPATNRSGRTLVHGFIQLMQLDDPPRFPGEGRDPLLSWAPAFAGVAGFGMSDGVRRCLMIRMNDSEH